MALNSPTVVVDVTNNVIEVITNSNVTLGGAGQLNDLSDLNKTDESTSSAATIRILADPDLDGVYTVVDYTPPSVGGGESNTASNGGTGGIGLVLAKLGVDLPFKSLNVVDAKLTIADDVVNSRVNIGLGSVASTDLSNSTDIVLSTATQTLTNKTIAAANNTLTIASTDLSNSADITLNTAIQTLTNKTIAATNNTITIASTDLSNSADVTLNTSAQTLTNKTIDTASNNITVVVADITDFDIGVSSNISVLANTLKVTNANHTGDVTGDGALTVQSIVITAKDTVTPVAGDFVLISDTSDGGNLKKVDANDFLSVVGGGESNTASNGGTGGVGIVLSKVGVDLPFKSIGAVDAKITVADDVPNSRVNIGFGSVASTDLSNSTDITLNTAIQTLTNKTITAATNTLTIASTDLTNSADITLNATAQTLTNKTIDTASNNITVVVADITDFDAEVSSNINVAANTAKVTNANHTGDVTGDGALTAQPALITGKTTETLGTGDFILFSDTSDSGNLKKANVDPLLNLFTDYFVIQIDTPADQDYFFGGHVAQQNYVINQMDIQNVGGGTCTATVNINGTPVTGLSGLAVTGTNRSDTATGANVVAVGNEVKLTISANASSATLVATIRITKT